MPQISLNPLFFLAFDHRGFFERKIAATPESPSEADRAAIVDAKQLIFEGVRVAASQVPQGQMGILVDEQYGGVVPEQAAALGVRVAVPAERSDRAVFEFQHGEDFGKRILEARPDVIKVLVRYNPDGDRDGNATQASRLRTLSEWLHANDTAYLFELLVEPTPGQLEAANDDRDRFEREQRPALMQRAMRELQAAGVEPHIWKVEGLDRVEDAQEVVEIARSEGRDDVVCTILGSGAPTARVEEWLRVAAEVDGFAGFAIGRSIWWPPLERHRAGEIDRQQAADEIAAGYLGFIDVFRGARASASAA